MYPLTHPILRTLHDEHLKTLGLLDRFEGWLRRQGAERVPDVRDGTVSALLADLVANMQDDIGHHFGFEEEHLFPVFSRFAEPGIPAMLRGEHEAIRPLARRLADLVAGTAEGFTPETWAEFHGLGRELVEREVFHVQKEEMGFLPAMDQMLDSEEAAGLAETYARTKTTEKA